MPSETDQSPSDEHRDHMTRVGTWLSKMMLGAIVLSVIVWLCIELGMGLSGIPGARFMAKILALVVVIAGAGLYGAGHVAINWLDRRHLGWLPPLTLVTIL